MFQRLLFVFLCLPLILMAGVCESGEDPNAVALARKWGQVGNQVTIRNITLGSSEAAAALLPHLNGLPHLRSISVAGVDLRLDQVRAIANGPALSTLRFYWCDITDAELELLARQTSLRNLYLDKTLITDAGLAPLAKLEQLEDLQLDRSQVTGPGLKALSGMDRLLKLTLTGSPITDAGLEHVGKIRHLRWLTLRDTQTSGDGILKLKDLVFIDAIHIGETFPITRDQARAFRHENLLARARAQQAGVVLPDNHRGPFAGIEDPPKPNVSEMRIRKRILDLQGLADPQEDAEATALARRYDVRVAEKWQRAQQANELNRGSTWVQHLEIDSAEAAEALLLKLRGLPFLISLDISDVNLSAELLQAIAAGPPIAGLDLRRCDIEDADLAIIAQQRHLESLSLSGNPAITDVGAAHLVKIGSLRRLWMKDAQLSREGLLKLANLVHLEVLEVSPALSLEDHMQFLQAQAAAREEARAAGVEFRENLRSPFPEAQKHLEAASGANDR